MDYQTIKENPDITVDNLQQKNEELKNELFKLSVDSAAMGNGNTSTSDTTVSDSTAGNIDRGDMGSSPSDSRTDLEIEAEKKFLLGKTIDWLIRDRADGSDAHDHGHLHHHLHHHTATQIESTDSSSTTTTSTTTTKSTTRQLPTKDEKVQVQVQVQKEKTDTEKSENTKGKTAATKSASTENCFYMSPSLTCTDSQPDINSASKKGKSATPSGNVSESSDGKKSGGFFKRLFSHKEKSTDTLPIVEKKTNGTTSSKGSSLNPSNGTSIRTTNNEGVRSSRSYSTTATVKNSNTNNNTNINVSKPSDNAQSETKLYRSRTTGSVDFQKSGSGSVDDRLVEFLKYYSKQSKLTENSSDSIYSDKQKSTDTKNNGDSNADDGDVKKTDFLGRPIPLHPRKSSFKSILKNKPDELNSKEQKMYTDSYSNALSQKNHQLHGPASPNGSKFGSFLKKVTSNIDPESEYDLEGMNEYYDNEYHSYDDMEEQKAKKPVKKLVSLTNEKSNSSIDSGSTNSSDGMYQVSSYSSTSSTEKDNDLASDNKSLFVVPPGLEEIKPLKKVMFSKSTFFNDPPQQICSRNPRQGEVEVKPNGVVIIHRLTTAQKKEVAQKCTQGIVVGGTGQLRLISDEEKKARELLNETKEDPYLTSTDPRKREIELIAAEVKAETRANEDSPLALKKMDTNCDDDIDVEKSASAVTIDKPMISRSSGSAISIMNSNSITSLSSMNPLMNDTTSITDTSAQSKLSKLDMDKQDGIVIPPHGNQAERESNQMDDNQSYPPKNSKIPNDVLYTRCCHLREILPVPSILKQIPKGKCDVIPILQLRNPKPSIIEIQSFSDYISIAPIMCLSLDGVSLTVDMFRTLLSSVLNNCTINKLSLKNTALDKEGWRFLCYFLTKLPEGNKFVSLDLTMVKGIHCNIQKPSKQSLSCPLKRMTSNETDRIDQNWNLLIASIGCNPHLNLHNIFVSGCRINHMDMNIWENFLIIACKNVERLGLAYNDLTLDNIKVLSRWISNQPLSTSSKDLEASSRTPYEKKTFRKLVGIDLGFNDLKGKLAPFIAIASVADLAYLSLNSTNLSHDEELVTFFNYLALCKNLKFLDLSNNPHIFPECSGVLTSSLPLCPTLLRLHLDNNKMDSRSLVSIAEMIPMCKNLSYLSILGSNLDQVSCKSLTYAVRKSETLISLNYDNITDRNLEWFPRKISIYTLKNTEIEIKRLKDKKKISDSSCGYLLPVCDKPDSISKIQSEMRILLGGDSDDNAPEFFARCQSLLENVNNCRLKLHNMIDELCKFRLQNDLSTEGKETLVRLCFIDTSLEKGVNLLNMKWKNSDLKITDPLKNTYFTNLKHQFQSFTGDHKHGVSDPSLALGTKSNSESVSSISTLDTNTAQCPDLNMAPITDNHELHDEPSIVDFQAPAGNTGKDVSNKFANDLNREEGKILKKTAKILNDRSKIPDILIKASESLSSNEIKEFILTHDVGEVVDLYYELEKGGVDFREVFKKNPNKNSNDNITTSLSESTPKQNHAFEITSPLLDKLKDEERSNSNLSNLSNVESIDSFEDDDELDRTYDQLLNAIEQVKSQSNLSL